MCVLLCGKILEPSGRILVKLLGLAWGKEAADCREFRWVMRFIQLLSSLLGYLANSCVAEHHVPLLLVEANLLTLEEVLMIA